MIYIVLDTETTGLNVARDGIISFSYILTDLEKEYERGTIEMNPWNGEPTPEQLESATPALKVNGYTPEQIQNFIPAQEGMKRIAEVIEKATTLNDGFWPTVMGYNSMAYDWPLIVNQATLYGITLPKVAYHQIDVYTLVVMLNAMGVMPVKRNPDGKIMGNKLCESVEKLEIEADRTKFHASMYDVEMTLAIFLKLKEMLNK